jgi:general secretion pathway protein G
MREAIDKYKTACDIGTFGAIKQGTFCYPETLEILVDGVKTQSADGKKMKFLRRIPRDPFTNAKEWGLRSMQDEAASESWSGDNVFNVYSKTHEKDTDGKPYSAW